MIILNLNPCFDNWIIVHQKKQYQNVIRGDEVLEFVDGKGLNIARVLSHFGYRDYCCLNILGRKGGVGFLIDEGCKAENLLVKNFWIKGRSRINTAIVEAWSQKMTIINQPGPTVTADEIQGLLTFFEEIFPQGCDLIISGSTPKGFPIKALCHMVEIALQRKANIKVDIGAQWLKPLCQYPLAMIKINEEEFMDSFHINPQDASAIQSLIRSRGFGTIIITLGSKGAIQYTKDDIIEAHIDDAQSQITVGSGDSFFAGYLYGQANNQTMEECLKRACVCGYANTLSYGPGFFSRLDYRQSLQHISIKKR